MESKSNLWAVPEGADLAFEWWEDECLVHHALSNDTHRIASWTAVLLEVLMEMPFATTQALADRCDLAVDEVSEALDSLARLELVVRA